MDIDGCGPAVINQLLDNGLISDPADLYLLVKSQLTALERMGDKSADNLLNAIAESKSRILTGCCLHSASAMWAQRWQGCLHCTLAAWKN